MARYSRLLVAGLLLALVAACVESPTGRRQLLLFSESGMSQMGVVAFDEMKKQQTIDRSSRNNRYVSCVADAVIAALPPGMQSSWEVVVFKDDSANAFALPGGKIGIHTGILDVAKTDAQLAAVIGHEIGHVMASHSAERMSVQFVSDTSQQLIAQVAGGSAQSQTIMAMLGLGAQVGVLLPYGRAQEAEADHIGLQLMAQAGFDPEASIALWQNMAQANNGQQPPEFLSTHPSHDTRMNGLKALIPRYEGDYQRAQAAGIQPSCQR